MVDVINSVFFFCVIGIVIGVSMVSVVKQRRYGRFHLDFAYLLLSHYKFRVTLRTYDSAQVLT
jgi:hypothetical protein